MWATLKHHRDNAKGGNDAVTLVYTESNSQRVSGHYSHGVLSWNDGDTWEKSRRHDDHGHHDSHHDHHGHEEVVAEAEPAPETPNETATEASAKSTQGNHLFAERKDSFHQPHPSTGDPFIHDKAQHTAGKIEESHENEPPMPNT